MRPVSLTLLLIGLGSAWGADGTLVMPYGGREIRVAAPDGVGVRSLEVQQRVPLSPFAEALNGFSARVPGGLPPEAFAAALGATYSGPGVAGTSRFITPDVDSAAQAALAARAMGATLVDQSMRITAQVMTAPNDPYWLRQWNLSEDRGIKIETGWDQVGGSTAVAVSVVDTGVQSSHPDLAGRLLMSEGYDYMNHDADAESALTGSGAPHGTFCSGQVAGVANNGIGIAGIAPTAKIVPVRLIQSGSETTIATTDQDYAAAMVRGMNGSANVAVCNNSWGIRNPGGIWYGGAEAAPQSFLASLRDGVTNGRGGKGIVYVFASGNDGGSRSADTVDWEGYANNPMVLAVGATDWNGGKADYSEGGACLFVSSPVGSSISNADHQTTGLDLVGTNGWTALGSLTAGSLTTSDYAKDGDYASEVGTSFAAPAVAGVAALLLSGHPELSWRDVRYLLALSARRNDWDGSGWVVNGAGFHWNPSYGFGIVDLERMATAVASYTPLPSEWQTVSAGSGTIAAAIPARGGVTTASLAVTSSLMVESVQLTVDVTHPSQAELQYALVSPAGTRIRIPRRPNDVAAARSWTFHFVGFLGETAQGTWTFEVSDVDSTANSGTLNSISLQIHGSTATAIAPEEETKPVIDGGTTGGGGSSGGSSGSGGVVVNDTSPSGGCGSGGSLAIVALLGAALARFGRRRRSST